jgi:hypothetical protein
MKRKLVATLVLLLITSLSVAEELQHPEPTQNPNAPYRLFSTRNIFTFLKLDTSNGRIWQLQWGNKDRGFVAPLSPKALVSDGKAGRFTLYPTRNIFTFILLDQETGDAWHVQWGQEADKLFIEPIDPLVKERSIMFKDSVEP